MDEGIATTLVRHGYIATAPVHPEKAISVQTLEFYAALSKRCGNIGIQPFVCSLADFQKVSDYYIIPISPMFNHLISQRYHGENDARQFSEAFDAYMEIRDRIDNKVDEYLYRDKRDFYKFICPPCSLKLDEEEPLQRSVLLSLGGNESLKRHRRLRATEQGGGEKRDTALLDNRARRSKLFLENDFIDNFKNEVKRSRKVFGLVADACSNTDK